MDKPIQQDDSLVIAQQIKRQKNPLFPYHTIGDAYSIKQTDYLIIVQLGKQVPILTIMPYSIKQGRTKKIYTKQDSIIGRLTELPLKAISVLKVQKLTLSDNNSKLQQIDFIIGYSSGYLMTVNYNIKNRKTRIKQYWNCLREKTSIWSKATNLLFGEEQFYKVWNKKVVKSVQICKGLFPYALQIGNMIILTTKITQQSDILLQKIYQQTQWKNPNLYSLSSSSVIRIAKQQYKAFSFKKQVIMIQWSQTLSSYTYKDVSSNYIKHKSAQIIYIASNGRIFLFDLNSLLILQQIDFQIGIRKINIQPLEQLRDVLIVTGEFNGVYLIQISKNRHLERYCKIFGHKAFVMKATMINNRIVTAGADHKIGMNHYATIKKWYRVDQQADIPIEPQLKTSKLKSIEVETQQKEGTNQFFDEEKKQKQKQQINMMQKKQKIIVKMPVKRVTRQKIHMQQRKCNHPIALINDRGDENTFQDIYALGIKTDQRNNLYDYGFGSMIKMGKMYCFFNLDGKIKIFDIQGNLS